MKNVICKKGVASPFQARVNWYSLHSLMTGNSGCRSFFLRAICSFSCGHLFFCSRGELMKVALCCACLFLSASFAVAQQSSNPVTDSVKLIMQRQAKNLPAAVDEMPADKFSFKPTPQQEPFAHIAVHVTESNNNLCAQLGTVPAPPKEDLSDTTAQGQAGCRHECVVRLLRESSGGIQRREARR